MATYQNKFSTKLSSETSAGATFSLLPELPTVAAPFYLAFDALNENGHYELKEITSKTGNSVTHTATTYDHTTLETVRLVIPSDELDDLTADIAAVLADSSLEPGIIRPYAGATAPTGWVLCDGTSYLRTGDYAALFDVIGTTYGAADGTHFNVPDVSGRVTMGFDSADTLFDALGETGGAKTVDLSHTHTGVSHTHQGVFGTSGPSASWQLSNDSGTIFSSSGHTHTVYINAAAGASAGSSTSLSAAQSILMPYLTLNLIIKL